jgi:hypothetical protein
VTKEIYETDKLEKHNLEQCIPLSSARARNSKSNETITENKIKTCIMGQTNFKTKKGKKKIQYIKVQRN